MTRISESEIEEMEYSIEDLAGQIKRLRDREAALVDALIGARNVLESVDFRDGTIAGRRMAIISRIGKINETLSTLDEG